MKKRNIKRKLKSIKYLRKRYSLPTTKNFKAFKWILEKEEYIDC